MHCNERSHMQTLPNKINIKKKKYCAQQAPTEGFGRESALGKRARPGPLQVQLPAEGRPAWSVPSGEVKL